MACFLFFCYRLTNKSDLSLSLFFILNLDSGFWRIHGGFGGENEGEGEGWTGGQGGSGATAWWAALFWNPGGGGGPLVPLYFHEILKGFLVFLFLFLFFVEEQKCWNGKKKRKRKEIFTRSKKKNIWMWDVGEGYFCLQNIYLTFLGVGDYPHN